VIRFTPEAIDLIIEDAARFTLNRTGFDFESLTGNAAIELGQN